MKRKILMGDVITTNRKAYRDYSFTDKWECGIELKGGEVKSIRDGNVNFKGTFARIEENEVILYNLYIDPYKQASHMNEEPDRPRKLLLHRREIKRIDGAIAQKSLALIPTKIYFNNRGFVKVELALGKGKKLYDKRETIQKRDIDRDLKRIFKNRKR